MRVLVLAWEATPTGVFWLPHRAGYRTVLDDTLDMLLDLTPDVTVVTGSDSLVRLTTKDWGVKYADSLESVPVSTEPTLILWGDCAYPADIADMLQVGTALVVEGQGSIGWNAELATWQAATHGYALRGWVYGKTLSELTQAPLTEAMDLAGIQPRLSTEVLYIGTPEYYGRYVRNED